MAGLSNTAMCDAADAIIAKYTYAQLHTAAAGGSGTSNVSAAGREAIDWSTSSSNGDFGLDNPIAFTGGASGGAVYSVTIWDADTSGTFGGEFVLTGDAAFNAAGEYNVTALSLNGSAS